MINNTINEYVHVECHIINMLKHIIDIHNVQNKCTKNVKVYISMNKASMDEDQLMGKVSMDE